ncbi:MAG: hypothetical protein RIK87_15050 [Fuerstiella sp.]
MEPQLAEITFVVIMSVGVCVWLLSLHMALNLGRHRRRDAEPWTPLSDLEINAGSPCDLTGQKTVRGHAEDVSKTLARTLLNLNVPGMFATLFEMVERTPERLEFRKTGPLVCNQPTGMYFSEAVFTLERTGANQVLVSYRLGFERLVKVLRRTALALILGLGFPVLMTVGILIPWLVLKHPNPAVRWQVFQTLQIVHVLWPPFLIIYLFRSGHRHARTFMANVLTSVELSDDLSQGGRIPGAWVSGNTTRQ